MKKIAVNKSKRIYLLFILFSSDIASYTGATQELHRRYLPFKFPSLTSLKITCMPIFKIYFAFYDCDV